MTIKRKPTELDTDTLNIIVEHHEDSEPRSDMLARRDAHFLVVCHSGGRYTVWKDRTGEPRSRVTWSELTADQRRMLVAGSRKAVL